MTCQILKSYRWNSWFCCTKNQCTVLWNSFSCLKKSRPNIFPPSIGKIYRAYNQVTTVYLVFITGVLYLVLQTIFICCKCHIKILYGNIFSLCVVLILKLLWKTISWNLSSFPLKSISNENIHWNSWFSFQKKSITQYNKEI